MRTIVTVSGMQAVHCVRAVQTAMALVPGITWCEVTIGRVDVEHDGRATATRLRDAIAVAGFPVSAVRDERRLPIIDAS
ncbi:MAG: heavy-metal-associated domain-containing protein [Gemmatimonadaceae bacterium]|nr:heavy-metal-associated domain-containing protein [Gemmatimonadaceae bacterium]